MGFPPLFSSDFLQCHSWIPLPCLNLHHPHSPICYPADPSLNPISAPLQLQSLLIGLCSSPSPPPSPRETSHSLVLLYEFLECFFNDTQNPTIGRDYGQSIGVGMENILLLDSDTSGVCKRPAMKKTISKKKTKRNLVTYLELCTRQFCLVYTHTSYRGQHPPS